MRSDIDLGTGPIALIAEGKSEKTYLDILLENDCLVFPKSRLLHECVLDRKYQKAQLFQKDFLQFTYRDKINVIFVRDRFTNFKIAKPYNDKIYSVNNIITKPEIEMLWVIHFNLWNEFKKQKLKPSDFIAQQTGKSSHYYKSSDTIREIFDVNHLLETIRALASKTYDPPKGCHKLIALLKEELR